MRAGETITIMNDDLQITSSQDLIMETAQTDMPEQNEHQAHMEYAQSAPESVASDASAEGASQVAAKAPHPFAEIGLIDSLVKAVSDLGYVQPTAVQARVIPMALRGAHDEGAVNDLMVSSQTGSGKTAAFLLPILHALEVQLRENDRLESLDWAKKLEEASARGEPAPKKPRRKNPIDPRHFKAAVPQALILCPTRELAQQVAHDAIDLVKHMRGVRIASVIGGLPYQKQIASLQNAMLVVATPGRLLDLERSRQIKLDQVQILVLDEADRMLDLGFSDDLAAIHELTQQRAQTLMFSATFAPRIQQLGTRIMRDGGKAAQRITIDTPQQQHANIKQALFWADSIVHRRALLDHWLRDTSIEQAIVFAGTQIECDGLANDLQEAGFSAVALHGALSQGLRNRRLMMLREGRVQFLVATDVAARGIDVPSISHVFNYGLPMKAEDYTHRIGRTGRAGRDGLAVTIAEFRDRRRVADVEHFTQQKLKVEVIPGLEPQSRPEPRRFDKNAKPKFGNKAGGQGFGSARQHSSGRGFEKEGYGQVNPERDGYKRQEPKRGEAPAWGHAKHDGAKPAGKPGFKKPAGPATKFARVDRRA